MSLGLKETLQKLKAYEQSAFPILSVYLPLPSVEKARNAILVKELHTLVKKNLPREQQAVLREDIEYIAAFLQTYNDQNHHKGLAIFSGDNQLWEVVKTEFIPDSHISVNHHPHLEPIFNQLKLHQRYLIILADRQKAKFLTLFSNSIEDQGEVFDNSVPQKVKANEEGFYGRSDKIARHIQDHLHQHLKLIAQRAGMFLHNRPIAGVIIGGHKELLHNIKNHLPKQLQEKIIGEFISELNISINEISVKSKKVIKQVNSHLNQHTNYSLNTS